MAHSEDNVNETPHFTYIWTIENMCLPCYVASPIFTVKQMEMTRWYLTIDAGNTNYIELEFRRSEDDAINSFELKFELSFLGCDGLPLIEKEGIKKFENDSNFHFEKFAEKNEVFFQKRGKFLPKAELTIRCRMWRTGIDIGQMNSCFARTCLSTGQQSFLWAIRDFVTRQRDHEKNLVLNNCPRKELTLNLYVIENGEEYLSICISTSKKVYDYEYGVLKICLLDFEGTVVQALGQKGPCRQGFKFVNFFEKRKLMNKSMLRNDVLLLRCEIEMNAKIVWSKIENYTSLKLKSSPGRVPVEGEILYSVQNGASNVTSPYTEAMQKLMKTGNLGDVYLRTGSKLFSAHMNVLSASSPVFAYMFRRDTITRESIDIANVDARTLEDLLSYIYANQVRELDWSRAVDLYRAADEYQVSDLKNKCATFLMSDLSVRSVADFHKDKELRKAAQDFVMEHGAELLTTDVWRTFKKKNPLLAFDMLERVLCYMRI